MGAPAVRVAANGFSEGILKEFLKQLPSFKDPASCDRAWCSGQR